MIIIHHSKDLDGWSSGAICKRAFPDATLIGWDYNDPIPDFEQFRDQEVIMIDITFPIAKIEELSDIAHHVTIIDHHISFKKEYCNHFQIDTGTDSITFTDIRERIKYIYEVTQAACEIGWKYLFPGTPIPEAITLLGRYDTWRQSEGLWDDETLPFQYGMRVKCDSPDSFDIDLFDINENSELLVADIIEIGHNILDYQKQMDKIQTEKNSFETIIGEYRAIALNIYAFSSNTVMSLYDPKKHDIMVGFCFNGVSKKWLVSLRSIKEDVDCSIIAKFRGGGGHIHAAGFECEDIDDIFN